MDGREGARAGPYGSSLLAGSGLPGLPPGRMETSVCPPLGQPRVPTAFLWQLLVKSIQLEDGKMIPASQLFRGADSTGLELTEEDLVTAEAVRVRDTCEATVWWGRSCTAGAFRKSHTLGSGRAHHLRTYVLAPGTVLVLSCHRAS